MVVMVTGDEEVIPGDLFKNWWFPGDFGQDLTGVDMDVSRTEDYYRRYFI